jgi:hypothetical protein
VETVLIPENRPAISGKIWVCRTDFSFRTRTRTATSWAGVGRARCYRHARKQGGRATHSSSRGA